MATKNVPGQPSGPVGAPLPAQPTGAMPYATKDIKARGSQRIVEPLVKPSDHGDESVFTGGDKD